MSTRLGLRRARDEAIQLLGRAGRTPAQTEAQGQVIEAYNEGQHALAEREARFAAPGFLVLHPSGLRACQRSGISSYAQPPCFAAGACRLPFDVLETGRSGVRKSFRL